MQRRASPSRRQQGSVVLFFVAFLVPLLMFGAFAINLARVSVVRNELQNAADAAALAGASQFVTNGAGTPDWAGAASATTAAIALNSSNNVQLSSGTVTTGYWNLAGSPSTLQATTITPGTDDAPAVQVKVSRSANQNGGLVSLAFGALLGLPSVAGTATAVAVAAPPGTVAGGLFPVALGQCLYDTYWDSSTSQPKIDPSTGAAYQFQIGSDYKYGGTCDAGQWTSFTSVANDVPTIRGLIANGNPTSLSIGDNIYIQPGAKATLYSSVPTHTVIYVPIVSNIVTKSFEPIVAFAAFYVDSSVGGRDKYIQGHFLTGYDIPQSSGIGPNYGGYVPPRLAY
ncbi:TadG family pilus assembly protein [Paraburkholderia sp. BL10I2N1]|uniref:pilus assembly protein TadG-related protein n=1 Tax=Paraburkholderia sp. BL10I2N1 TaxID=1938796 RepID=UPI0010602F32|nr:TadG family pilus assembly protein [Paraburkholderia sp. BL10I2N1]